MLVAYHYQILFLSEMRLTYFYVHHSILKGLICSCCQKALLTLLHNIITISLICRYAVLILYIGSLQLFYSIWLQINFRVLNKVQVFLLPVLVPQISFITPSSMWSTIMYDLSQKSLVLTSQSIPMMVCLATAPIIACCTNSQPF